MQERAPHETKDVTSRALEWLFGEDTGLSSRTIAGVMLNMPRQLMDWARTPIDGDDLGRCLRLLEKIPEWKSRLDEVGDAYPSWRPLIEHWSELQSLYADDLVECRANGTYRMPRVYDKLKS